jgi:hypothetical protein
MSREDERRLGTADFLAAGEHKHHEEDAAMPAGMDPVALQRMQQQHDQGTSLQQVETLRRDAQVRGEGVDPRVGSDSMERQMHSEGMERQIHGGDLQAGRPGQGGQQGGQLAALFLADVAQDFKRRWDAIQIGFVDDPREAVRSADELVAEVMKTLAESFARQRGEIEAGVDRSEQANTENLRLALHQYRSFFQRLLSL